MEPEGIVEDSTPVDKHILVQFKSENGDVLGSPFDMPANLSKEKLQMLCYALQQKVSISRNEGGLATWSSVSSIPLNWILKLSILFCFLNNF